MRVLLGLLLVATPAAAGKKATIGSEPIPVGLRVDVSSTMTMSMDMKLDMELETGSETHDVHNSQTRTEVSSAKATAVAPGGQVTGFEITWTENAHGEKGPATDDTSFHMPVVGPTFVVTGESVVRADGQPLTEGQSAYLARLDDPFIRVTRLTEDVRGTKVKIGQVIPSDLIFPGDELPQDPGADATVSGTMTLREIRPGPTGDEGVFDLALVAVMTQTGDGDRMEMRLELGGELAVDVDTGWMNRVTASGPLSMTASNSVGMKMTGTGRFSTEQAHTYRP